MSEVIHRPKNLLKNLIALVLGLAFALIVAEGATRLMSDIFGISPYMQYDEMIGWVATPNATKNHNNQKEDFSVVYHINAAGLRGELYEKAKPEGQRRIIILGDSNGFGWGVEEGKHFAALLDQELENTEVVNFSLSGYGTDQQFLRYVRDGAGLNPDIVILQVTPNDFSEIQSSFSKQKPKPQFIFDGAGSIELVNIPVRSVGPEAEKFFRNSIPVPFKEWLGWNSYAYNFLNQQYHGWGRKMEGKAGGESDKPVFSPSSIRLFAAIVSKLQQEIVKVGATGLIVYSSPVLQEELRGVDLALPVIDAYPRFLAEREQGREPLYGDGYHWNGIGHRAVADELIQVLRKQEFLDQGSETR